MLRNNRPARVQWDRTMEGLAVYLPPAIKDYGDLRAMTAMSHPLFGNVAAASDLSFSEPLAPGPAGAGAVAGEGASSSAQAPSGGGGAGGVAAGGGGAGGGGGGKLPFTGLAVGVVAAVGSALGLAGATLRRALRRSER
jgi:hypothetical protein